MKGLPAHWQRYAASRSWSEAELAELGPNVRAYIRRGQVDGCGKVPPVKLHVPGVCDVCRGKFVRYRGWQRYCSAGCRWKGWDRRHPRVRG